MPRPATDAELRAAYAALGAAPTDAFPAIRAAWRRLVKAHHPDVAGAGSTARLAAINEAYDTLRHHRTLRADEAGAQGSADETRRRQEAARRAEAARETAARQAEEARRAARATRRAEEAAARAAAAEADRAEAAALARRRQMREASARLARSGRRTQAAHAAYAALRGLASDSPKVSRVA